MNAPSLATAPARATPARWPRLALLAVLLCFFPEGAAMSQQAGDDLAPWTGTWKTWWTNLPHGVSNEGLPATLTQRGTTVTGTYGSGHKIRGEVNGRTLSGRTERFGLTRFNEDPNEIYTGTFSWTMSEDYQSFKGTYGDGAGPWSGERQLVRRPDLTSVEIVDPDTLDPIDEIAIGESFRVRLTFAEDPGTEITETVTIRTSDGSALKIHVTGNSQVIVSEPISVVPAEADRTRVEP